MPEPGPVAVIIAKARLAARRAFRAMSVDEDPLSRNRVTGWSVNYPIMGTCRPTRVCAQTCYFAKGPTTWPTAIEKQLRLYRNTAVDPQRVADRIARSCDHHRVDFLRWNGGGDLFPQAVLACNRLALIRPRLPIWVVTRRPELAARLDDLPNLYVHFSLDRDSLDRRDRFLALRPASTRYFFSYQAEPGERPDPALMDRLGVSVLFFDRYRPTDGAPPYGPALCPLNVRPDIADACRRCRRCFDGSAVAESRRIDPTPTP